MKKTDNQEVKQQAPIKANAPLKAEPVKAQPAPAKAEPVKAQPVKAEPAKVVTPKAQPAQPLKAEPAKAQSVPQKVETVKAQPLKAEPIKTAPPKANPTQPLKAEPAKAQPVPAKAEPIKAEPAKAQSAPAKAASAPTQPAPSQPKVEEKKEEKKADTTTVYEMPKPLLQEPAELQDIPAAQVTARTRKDHRKTSVAYTTFAIILMIIAILPIIIMPVVLATYSNSLVPYYGIWPFVGVIIACVFGIIYMVVALCVTRKRSKSDVKMQTAKIATAFICLTCVFALIITYILPDIVSYFTQNTLFVEDMTYNSQAQAEENAQLERDFIMYNVVNGNLNSYDSEGRLTVDEEGNVNGDFSYATLSKRVENSGRLNYYVNKDINTRYKDYLNKYGEPDSKTGVLNQEKGKRNIENMLEGYYKDPIKKSGWVKGMKETDRTKYDLYNFIYTNYVLLDYDYALSNKVERRAFTLAIVDYIYENSTFTTLLKEGWTNPRLKALFDNNFNNFKQDGYNTLDDPLLLYAQLEGRLTTTVIIQLLLNGGYTYSQPSYGAVDGNGDIMYTEEGNCLYQIYDMDAVQEYRNGFASDELAFPYTTSLINDDGTSYNVKYGFNKDGWMMFENGVTKRPLNWLVLDMQGTPMDLTTIDLSGLSVANIPIGSLIPTVLDALPTLVDSLGNFIGEDLIDDVIIEATGGAKLKLGICFDDTGALAINIYPMNPEYGMIGFAQASWVESGHLLFAIINVIGLRNWFVIFGAVGVVLIIAAGILRECGQKTRERTEISRFRMQRQNVEKDKKAYEEQQAKLEEERKAKEKQQRIETMRTRKY